jgi:hypothetical protein
MITLRANETQAHIKIGAWSIGNSIVKQRAIAIIDRHLSELVNKKVVFIAGGVGRIAAYAAQNGVDSYNLDISDIYETICASNYPKVKYIKANMCYPLDGFDYAVFEDCFTNRSYTSDFYENINNWQKVAKILPLTHSLYVFRFNSKQLDKYLHSDEPEGRRYTQKALSTGGIKAFCSYEDVEDLDIEEVVFNLNNPIPSLFIEPYSDKKYTVLGTPYFADNTLVGNFFTNGVSHMFLKNSITPFKPLNPDKYLVK